MGRYRKKPLKPGTKDGWDAVGALPREIAAAQEHLAKSRQDYYALGRFIMPIRNELDALGARWEKGERTLLLCQEIMAIKVPAA